MAQIRQPIMKDRKQLIRLWFEFYKLCFRQEEFSSNLAKSSEYYKAWGDVRGILFDEWWASHKSLFGGTRVTEINHVVNQPNAINVTIPLNQPISRSLEELKALIQKKQQLRFEELGIDASQMKSRIPYFCSYEFTKGVEIRGKTLYEILLMYTIWLDMEKPKINTAYCIEVVNRLQSRPRSKWIPYILQAPPKAAARNINKLQYSESQLRQVRRYIEKGKQVCRSVSNGDFPGKSNLK